ncbi:carbohydrate kinase family protein [Paractinoplanes hotanensis]|uniref:Sugar kinase n=1 Tax=Paractinoplanes hotanensis TaxID=2906497 RepID=A0ABT0XR89_9ACTN|nr:sugar kinase [Actinoplanes hotanensis]MCM4076185.1 sugar kinase [Actinoplanes hotanensis]
MTEFDVLVVGDANPDLLLRGDVRPRFGQEEQLLTAADLVLGGSAAITAVGCAKLGLRTALLAAVGDDVFGALVREQVTAAGVRLMPVAAGGVPTGVTVILSEPDDRAMLTLPGTITALRHGDLTDMLIQSTRHVHMSALYLQPALASGLAGAFKRVRDLGRTTSLDTNWDPSGAWASVNDILEHTDVFLPNAAELLAVTGAATPDAAAAELVRTGTTVVMKDGARGARAWWPGGECAAPGVTVEVVDTTGAGDSFNAGFLAARLVGHDLPESLRWATTAGSLSTRAAGGTAAQATLADLSG